jgi:hypothetical protein
MDDDRDRVDFSSLDPRRNPARYDRLVAGALARAAALRADDHPTVLAAVARWNRLAAGVAVAAALGAVVVAMRAGRTPDASPAAVTSADVVNWAWTGDVKPLVLQATLEGRTR